MNNRTNDTLLTTSDVITIPTQTKRNLKILKEYIKLRDNNSSIWKFFLTKTYPIL